MEATFLRLLGMDRERRGRWGALRVWMGAVLDGIWNGWMGRLRKGGEGMSNVWADLRYTGRALRRHPSFTAVVVLSLALGIGGSTAIFSVFNTVLLEDLPYAGADRIYMMRTVAPDGSATGGVTPPEARYLTDNPDHPIVEALAYGWSQETQIVGDHGVTYGTRRYGVTEQFFDVFGTGMAVGPGFEGGDAGPIVIAHPIWRDLFASDPDIIGKTIQVEGTSRQVVGVTPESFSFPEDPGYWSLMRLGPGYDRTRYRAYVRLRPGRTEAQFQAELERLPVELGLDPATGRPMTYVAQPFLDYVVGDLRATVTILLGATVILLLIACINVTNLMLSRATANAREAALREALGAGRWRILRRLTTESLVLAFAGGALGLVLGAAGVRLLLGIGPALPRLDAVPMDRTVLAFALGVTVLTGLLIGLAPAWRLARSELRSLVNEGGRGARGGRAPNRVFGPLVVAEVALAVMLVIGAGLLVRTYSNLTTSDPGSTRTGR
jgi:predicted permease